jgi:probable rRNA maturation factor
MIVTAPLQFDTTIAINDPAWAREVKDIQHLAEHIVLTTLTHMRAHLPEAIQRTKNIEIGLAVVFTDNKEMQDLNYRFRGKNAPTNVLSFPADVEAPQPDNQEWVLGDVILAYGVVAQEAEEQQKTLIHHMTHMVVHGLLHLLGFDHIVEAQANVMEAYERDILRLFAISDPYRVGHFMNDTHTDAG